MNSIWEWRQNNWRFTHDAPGAIPGGDVPDRDLWELLDYVVRQYELVEYVVQHQDTNPQLQLSILAYSQQTKPRSSETFRDRSSKYYITLTYTRPKQISTLPLCDGPKSRIVAAKRCSEITLAYFSCVCTWTKLGELCPIVEPKRCTRNRREFTCTDHNIQVEK